MNGSKINTIIIGLVGILVSLLAIMQTMTSGTSSVSTAVKYVGIGLALICLMKPRLGLFIVSAEAFTVDYVKKVAVYYGQVSTMTIIEAMAVVMLAVVATIGGMLINTMFGKGQKMNRGAWLLFLAGLLWSGLIIVNGIAKGSSSLTGLFQTAFNSGAYLGLAAVVVTYFSDRKSVLRLLDFQCLLAVVSAIWVFKQVAFGWNNIELFYVDTHLSAVASHHYLLETATGGDPRPTGLASGSKNLGYLAGYFVYAIYRVFTLREKWVRYFVMCVILGVALVLSRQKAPIVIGLAVPFLALVYRSKWMTLGLYGVAASLFIAMVMNAETLRSKMGVIDEEVRSSVGASGTYSLRTFSARLDSYRILKDPDNWSMFGLKKERIEMLKDHDIFTSILINTGAVSLFLLVSVLTICILLVHREGWRIRMPMYKKMYFAFLAYVVVTLAVNFTGGSNLHTLPINLTLWTFAGGLLVASGQDKVTRGLRAPAGDQIREGTTAEGGPTGQLAV